MSVHACARCGEPAGDVCLWCWQWHCAACLEAPELCPDCHEEGHPQLEREYRPGVAVVDVDTGGRL